MRILTNFPYSPFVRHTGSSQRFLQQIKGLCQLGHDVTIWSIPPCKLEYGWTTQSLDEAENLGIRVKLTDTWELPKHFLDGIDAVWINYYTSMPWFEDFGGLKILDMHDCLSIHWQIEEAINQYTFRVNGRKKISPEIFEDIVNPIWTIHPSELEAYSKCDVVVAISKKEYNLLCSHGVNAKYIPHRATQKPISERVGGALFCGTSNPINLLGHGLLGEILLPAIRKRQPQFECDLLGELVDEVVPYGTIRYLGFQQEPDRVYNFSGFGLNPIPRQMSTGMKIKLISYMERGLPVVSFEDDGLPLISDETGFICESNEEFVENCVRLWDDRDLRVKLGRNAQEAIASYYTEMDHLRDLEEICD